MRIVLHPGLHKTGTTSIQMYLRLAFGSEEPRRIWYPMRPILNPGHAQLPRLLSQEATREEGLELARRWVRDAAQAGTEVLVISAEGISRLKREALAGLRAALGSSHRLQVIITLASWKTQQVSQWQERIKHSGSMPLGDRRWPRKSPLRTDMVSYLIDSLEPDECVGIIGRRDNAPERLIDDFVSAAGLREAVAALETKPNLGMQANKSFGLVEIEVIRHLNLCIRALKDKGIEFDHAFVKRRMIACMTSREWKERVPKVRIECPEGWLAPFREQAREAREDLARHIARGRVRVIGELDWIDEGLA